VADVPAIIPDKAIEDVMSDSESEDDGEDDPLIPTPSIARSIWEDEAASALAPAEEEAGAGEIEAEEEEVEETEPQFARDREMLRLEQEKAKASSDAASRLATRMQELKQRVRSARCPFALQGYGQAMPAHLRQWAHPSGAGATEAGPVL